MRALLLTALTLTMPAWAQTPAASPAASTQAAIAQALAGDWVGVLEYRDYSEPPTSSKRVALPTWLTITLAPDHQVWRYTYDDGPAKVLQETDAVFFNAADSTYSEAANGKPASLYKVSGYDKLTAGRGVLVLSGAGTDNGKPSETRVTLTIRRNLIEILEEVRPAGSQEPFVFRHAFRFTRAQPPAVTAENH